MKFIAAYAMLVLGGNKNPSATDVRELLKAAGIHAEYGDCVRLTEKLKNKEFHEMVQLGIN